MLLVLRALGLGDFLTGLPAIQLLKEAHPAHELVLAAPAVFAPIVELAAAVEALQPTGELMPIDRRYVGVDVAVDLHGKGPASRRLLAELRPCRLVGFAHPAAGLVGPAWLPGEREVTRWCRMVAEAFGLTGRRWPGVVGAVEVPPLDAPAGVTIVHPGAAAGSRRWLPERFAEVATELRRQGHRVVITGGSRERSLVQGIATATGATAMLGLSLVELFAVVASARLVVCGDTGVAHVASNYQTPSVVLFGPVSPVGWGPPPDPRHRAIFHGDGRGDPHAEEPDPALLRITVPEVLAAVAEVAAAVPSHVNPVSSASRRSPW